MMSGPWNKFSLRPSSYRYLLLSFNSVHTVLSWRSTRDCWWGAASYYHGSNCWSESVIDQLGSTEAETKYAWEKNIVKLLYQDLSYDESFSGRPGDWLVKKIFFIWLQSQNLNKDLILKFKMIYETCLNFMIAFMVY